MTCLRAMRQEVPLLPNTNGGFGCLPRHCSSLSSLITPSLLVHARLGFIQGLKDNGFITGIEEELLLREGTPRLVSVAPPPWNPSKER